MRVPALRRHRQPELPGVGGTARLDRRTKNLTRRIRPGEVAIIDHIDLDRVSAEALIGCRVSAVVNAQPSVSGRYPNLGPEILIGAGIPLLDDVGPEVFGKVEDGALVWLDSDTLCGRRGPLVRGTLQTKQSVADAMEEARSGLALQLEAFAGNTMEYLRRERDLLLDGVGVPVIDTRMEGRQVLVVVRGYHYREDIEALRPYIREYRPLFIGVDGGADALLEAGYKPHVIVGDMDSVSDAALGCGAELVVHAYRDGRAPGLARVERLGLPAAVFPATGTSEDVALLLADDKGAELIVAVGTHATLTEFLDKGRAGMASTFLTRLRVGGKLVDAKGVSRLYRSRISTAQLMLLVLAALITLIVALSATETGKELFAVIGLRWDDFGYWFQGLF